MTTQEAYKKKMAAQLKELDAQINLYEAKLENVGADIKIKHTENIQALRAKRQAVNEKLNELGDASSDAWDSLKESTDKLWSDLKSGVAEAQAKFK